MNNLDDSKLGDSASPSNEEYGIAEACPRKGISEEDDIHELTARMNSVQERTMNMDALNETIVQGCEEAEGQATMAQLMENQPPGDISQFLFAALQMAGEKKVKLVGQRGQLLEPHELSVQLQRSPPEED
ncbi:uncharacterized protein LOC133848024 [Drosophila sulfurigaster albostrigata]|uniref:uncharacterized protein LOC133848024 n=1 Tax=Drosophila sulfurigaster albostrigata TaxID=89887 RepID=UPI002D21A073|nr:uncharacterized protein LOC133848024 [Drosophila sulfurigaster albostrigata]